MANTLTELNCHPAFYNCAGAFSRNKYTGEAQSYQLDAYSSIGGRSMFFDPSKRHPAFFGYDEPHMFSLGSDVDTPYGEAHVLQVSDDGLKVKVVLKKWRLAKGLPVIAYLNLIELILAEAQKYKKIGNMLFEKGQKYQKDGDVNYVKCFENAIQLYAMANQAIISIKADTLSDKQSEDLKSLYLACWGNVSQCQIFLGQFKEAANNATLALQMDEYSFKNQLRLATALLYDGDTQQALKICKEAIAFLEKATNIPDAKTHARLFVNMYNKVVQAIKKEKNDESNAMKELYSGKLKNKESSPSQSPSSPSTSIETTKTTPRINSKTTTKPQLVKEKSQTFSLQEEEEESETVEKEIQNENVKESPNKNNEKSQDDSIFLLAVVAAGVAVAATIGFLVFRNSKQ